jgi:endogenous inhibitor of DNA gyrase (YacG/DUF329 family)
MACPICSKPAEKPYSPFCSRRCADVDLSRWLKGGYAIPGGAGDDADDAPGGPESPENSNSGSGGKPLDRE